MFCDALSDVHKRLLKVLCDGLLDGLSSFTNGNRLMRIKQLTSQMLFGLYVLEL